MGDIWPCVNSAGRGPIERNRWKMMGKEGEPAVWVT